MRLHEIYTLDDDEPVVAERVSQLGHGIQYTDADGCAVLVPWGRVIRVVGRRVADPAEADPAAEADVPAVAEPETSQPAEPDGEPDEGKAGKASEWAETDPAAVREWAQAQGLAVADSGPISKAVLTKYAAAHSD